MRAQGRRVASVVASIVANAVVAAVPTSLSTSDACASGDVVRFTDEAAARGVDHVVVEGVFAGTGQFGCGVLLADLDGDGDDDLLATGGAGGAVGLFRNDGTGHFTRVAKSGLGPFLKASGVVAADYDGDGDLDVFVTRWLSSAYLFRNEGGLAFVNVTTQAGLAGNTGAGAGASFGDHDGDGDLDLAIANRTGTLGNGLRNRFYRNEGDGTFVEISAALGVNDAGASFHCLLQDLDRDGDCDLYVSNDKGTAALPNRFFRNTGGAFVAEPDNGACVAIDSMGIFAGDLDGDGHVEIFCANVGSGSVLLATADDAHYADVAGAAGVAGSGTQWGALVFDADNDADDDLAVLAMADGADRLYLNEGGFPLVDRAAAAGLGDPFDSYCLAASDVDRDGDVDLLVQDYQQPLRLMINEPPSGRSWIRLRVVGRGMNVHAVGALVDVETGSGGGGVVLREVLAGTSYKSQSSYLVHVGLGAATSARSVRVRWPRLGGVVSERTISGLPAGHEWPIHPPERLGDVDGDGRVEHAEVVACAACAQGPFVPGCAIFDFDGDARVDAADVAAATTRLCDLDRDGVVGAGDLSHLLAAWGTPDADLTGDALVDGADLAALFASW